VNPDELSELSISVDLLTPPERVEGMDNLDPKIFGVIVERGWQRGLLLPDLEGIDTAEQQVEIACRKAGIDPDETVTLYRFQVKRYK
jgi:AMMECR1 domain-containing protein